MKLNTKSIMSLPIGSEYTYANEVKEMLIEQLITHGRTAIMYNSIIYSPAIVLVALADGYMERVRDFTNDSTYLRITNKGMEFLK